MAYVISLSQVYRQTGSMNCWFYAAKTIIHHATGRLLLESDYLGTTPPTGPVTVGRGAGAPSWLMWGLPPASVGEFAAEFGFAEPSTRPANWTPSMLEQTLRAHGPLWFGGHSGSFNHVVVVCGVNASSAVVYADPATGARAATASLAEFNGWKRQMMGLPNPLYYAAS